jgi:Flp pilus assembly protein TadD
MGERADQIINNARICVRHQHLKDAINILQPLYDAHPNLWGYDDYQLVTDNYQRMVEYMKKGFLDPEREKLYRQLLRRIYRIIENLAISWRCKNLSIYVEAFQKTNRLNMSYAFIQDVLERFVSDVAMLSLESEDTSQAHSDELYGRHAAFIERLFNALFISLQWNSADEQFYTKLLLSPTIDVVDQQLMVSAIGLACMNIFDIHKFNVLAAVYQKAEDVNLRQRALVGFMFSTNDHPLFAKEQQALMDQLTDNGNNQDVLHELLEMQVQVFYCMNAEEDDRKIQSDIIPSIMKNNNFTITRHGIEEKEDDPLEGILNPDAEDQAMEELDKSLKQMAEMQKNGADVFFGGFKQMKRIPFFDDFYNWFCPFYSKHPRLRSLREKTNIEAFLNKLSNSFPFCDSDKYSFVYAFASVAEHMPEGMKEMFYSGGDMGEEMFHTSRVNPTYVRHRYLQDLYRFFRLYRHRASLVNPFGKEGDASTTVSGFFLTLPFFDDARFYTMKTNLGTSLYKQKRFEELRVLLSTYSDESDTNYLFLKASSFIKSGLYEDAVPVLEQILSKGDEPRALKSYARVSMLLEHYQQAADSYRKLQELMPGHKNYLLNEALALLQLGQKQEAVEKVYQCDLQYPDDDSVQRILAWVLLNNGKVEQAADIYRRLLEQEPIHEDYVNAAYSVWIRGDISTAVNYFQQSINLLPKGKNVSFLEQEINNDRQLLIDNGIAPIDLQLILDLI